MSLSAKMKNIVAPPARASGYDEALGKVREIAAELQGAMNHPKVGVIAIPGHKVNMGQEFRFTIRRSDPNFSDTLLRCYILPQAGYPVTLSLFEGEHPTCSNAAELEDQIMEFLAREPIAERIRSIASMV